MKNQKPRLEAITHEPEATDSKVKGIVMKRKELLISHQSVRGYVGRGMAGELGMGRELVSFKSA